MVGWRLEVPQAATASAAAIGAAQNRRVTLLPAKADVVLLGSLRDSVFSLEVVASISVAFFGLLVEQALQRLAKGIQSAAHEQKEKCDAERAFISAAGRPGRDRERDERDPKGTQRHSENRPPLPGDRSQP